MQNFWKELKKPFTALAPMEDVTDYVFREVLAEIAPPDVFFTEFTSVEGLCSAGYEKVVTRLKYSEKQRPIVAQIWGTNPQKFYETSKIVENLGFDGIDINMGCPDKAVIKIGAGAALIENLDLVAELIKAVKDGAKNIPVSVKTRTGFNKVITEDWAEFLLKQGVQALTIHGRTKKQMSKAAADWKEIAKAVKIRDKVSPKTIIVGNGDVLDYADACNKAVMFGVDGIMIGRGIFADPWIFVKDLIPKIRTTGEKINLLLRHSELFERTWGDQKNFAIMKKFFKIYVRNFEGSGELRQQLMKCASFEQVKDCVKETTLPN